MNISATATEVLPGPIAALQAQTESLAEGLVQASPEQVQEIASDFESLFISLLLKEMRQTLDGGFFGGDGADVYGGIFDMTMGRHLAESKILGVGDMITRYVEVAKQ